MWECKVQSISTKIHLGASVLLFCGSSSGAWKLKFWINSVVRFLCRHLQVHEMVVITGPLQAPEGRRVTPWGQTFMETHWQIHKDKNLKLKLWGGGEPLNKYVIAR